MKKFLFFTSFLFIIFLFSSKPAIAAYVNWVQEDTGKQFSGSGGPGIAGSPSNVGDNDLNTNYSSGSGCGPSQCPVVGGFVTVNIIFSLSNIKIDKTELTLETQVNASGQIVQKYYVKVYNGNWYTVSSGQQSGNYGKQTIVADFSEYQNVSQIEIQVYGMGATSWMGGNGWARAYEIKAWGNKVIAPIISTSDASGITSSQATLNGNITDTGGENVLERGFDWGTSSGSYPNSWTESGSFSAGSFNHQIIGLNQQTVYYFRAKARNSAGWSYGSEKSFATLSAYIDCGLRIYDGTSNIAIACEPAGTLTSPLRIYKGSSIYGIVLVPTSDSNASKIRIQTSSGIKALRKF